MEEPIEVAWAAFDGQPGEHVEVAPLLNGEQLRSVGAGGREATGR